MEITLNGKRTQQFDAPLSVKALLEALELDGKPVLVELGGEALRPREFAGRQVTGGAVVEIILVAAGG